VIQYEYDTGTLSTAASHYIIKGSGSRYNFNEVDVDEYHDVDIGCLINL
jgi:hypothetical protein